MRYKKKKSVAAILSSTQSAVIRHSIQASIGVKRRRM